MVQLRAAEGPCKSSICVFPDGHRKLWGAGTKLSKDTNFGTASPCHLMPTKAPWYGLGIQIVQCSGVR